MKRRLALSALAVGSVTMAYYLFGQGIYSARLSDGSSLRIQTVSYGKTNVLIRGSRIERVAGRLIPKAGLKFLGLTLTVPSTNQSWHPSGRQLALLFNMRRASKDNVLLDRELTERARVVFSAEEGIEYYAYLAPFSKHGDAYYAISTVTAFPRMKHINVRIEVMEGGDRWKNLPGRWKELTRFRIGNPARAEPNAWVGEAPPITKRAGPMKVTFGEVLMASPPTNFMFTRPDVIATYAIRTEMAGQIVTNWLAQDIVLREPTGNFLAHSTPLLVTNGWRKYAAWGTLDPKQIWKVEAQLARDSGFNSNELFTFQVPVPLPAPIQTNLSGERVRIEFVNQDMLAVYLEDEPKDNRLTFVKAVDEKGNLIHEHTGSWSQHRFWKMMRMPQAGGKLEATVAIHTNLPVEFFIRPGPATQVPGGVDRAVKATEAK